MKITHCPELTTTGGFAPLVSELQMRPEFHRDPLAYIGSIDAPLFAPAGYAAAYVDQDGVRHSLIRIIAIDGRI